MCTNYEYYRNFNDALSAYKKYHDVVESLSNYHEKDTIGNEITLIDWFKLDYADCKAFIKNNTSEIGW